MSQFEREMFSFLFLLQSGLFYYKAALRAEKHEFSLLFEASDWRPFIQPDDKADVVSGLQCMDGWMDK